MTCAVDFARKNRTEAAANVIGSMQTYTGNIRLIYLNLNGLRDLAILMRAVLNSDIIFRTSGESVSKCILVYK